MLLALGILIYCLVGFNAARMLAWHWNEPHKDDRYDICKGDRQVAALGLSLFFLPVALMLLYSAQHGVGFDKPPKAVRQAAEAKQRETKLIEAESMIKDLQKEIDRLAKM